MSAQEKIPYRPFGLIKELVESQGFPITHYYEDLIFTEHNAFLLQMGEKGEDVSLVFNTDCETGTRDSIEQVLTAAGRNVGLHFTPQGTYKLTPNDENETIDIEFIQP
ncbi:hypothetical protein [Desulforhopalus sp. 52FAK]